MEFVLGVELNMFCHCNCVKGTLAACGQSLAEVETMSKNRNRFVFVECVVVVDGRLLFGTLLLCLFDLHVFGPCDVFF